MQQAVVFRFREDIRELLHFLFLYNCMKAVCETQTGIKDTPPVVSFCFAKLNTNGLIPAGWKGTCAVRALRKIAGSKFSVRLIGLTF